jgi:hypothetical protein
LGFLGSRLLRRFFWDIGIPSGRPVGARVPRPVATLGSFPWPYD